MKFRLPRAGAVLVGAVLFFGVQQGWGAAEQPDAFVLKGVSFVQNSVALEAGSGSALEALLKELQADPSVSIEIKCTVAASGDPRQDEKLSRERAQTLRRWLMNRGIAFYRLEIADPQTSTPVSGRPAAPLKPEGDRIEVVRIQKSFPVADAPVRSFRFEPVVEGEQVLHDFQLRNEGDAPLNISKIRTG
jgi:hypothetical protein